MTAHSQTVGDAESLADLDYRLAGWRPDQVGTLMFLENEGRVLLIRKRRGHGAGRINGPGGKPEPGETPLQCVLRETEEEVGVRPSGTRLCGIFRFVDQEHDDWLGFVFAASGYTGTPRSTAEAIPAWYPVDDLPFDEMWEDDRYWLPAVLAGERVEGEFLFRSGRLLAHRLRRLAADRPFSLAPDFEVNG